MRAREERIELVQSVVSALCDRVVVRVPAQLDEQRREAFLRLFDRAGRILLGGHFYTIPFAGLLHGVRGPPDIDEPFGTRLPGNAAYSVSTRL
ncbi:hypothetical protein ACFQ3Z_07685 [Streptomyces nogalater]